MFFVSTPFLPGSEKKGVVLGPSNQLKIAENEAYRYPFIATEDFMRVKNLMGILVV